MPYDHGLIFQDGRPLIYDSGDYPAVLAKLKKLIGWDDFGAVAGSGARRRGGGWGSGWPATSRAPGSGLTRARTWWSRRQARSRWRPG